MANAVFPKFKAACIRGGANTNLVTGPVKVVLVADGYTYSTAHEFLSDIPGGDQAAISGALAGCAVSDLGAFTSSNGYFTSVTSTEDKALVLIVDTGVPATSRLIAYLDTSVTGLPVTPAGSGYNIIADPTGWFVL
jgi:hypothetical protein